MHPARVVDWSQKDQLADVGVVVPPSAPVISSFDQQAQELPQAAPVWGAPDSIALQMPPVQMLPMQVIVCDASGRPQQVMALPAYAVPAQQVPCAPSHQQAQQHQQEQDLQRAPLSSSAKRRLRRQRAAERRLEMPDEIPESATPEPASPRGGDAVGLDCEALTDALEAGDEARVGALAAMRGAVAQLALDREGCRFVQAAIKVADRAIVAELLEELRGRVLDLLASQHGNYVLQAIVEALPSASSAFVVRELLGSGAWVARHRFGCRVLCRLVEHCGGGEGLGQLLTEVLAEAEGHCRHPFAHYVLEAMLEHLPEYRRRIAAALCADLQTNARHRCASHVIEAALSHCSEAEQQALVFQLLCTSREDLLALAQHQYGSFVLRGLCQVPCRASEQALTQIAQEVELVSRSKHGQRLLQDLGFGPGDEA